MQSAARSVSRYTRSILKKQVYEERERNDRLPVCRNCLLNVLNRLQVQRHFNQIMSPLTDYLSLCAVWLLHCACCFRTDAFALKTITEATVVLNPQLQHHIGHHTHSTIKLKMFGLSSTTVIEASVVATAASVLIQQAVYWRMQFITATMVNGIPSKRTVVDLNTQNGKNVFYVPGGTEYIAIMSTGSDPKKRAEKSKMNERLILECVGRANRCSGARNAYDYLCYVHELDIVVM